MADTQKQSTNWAQIILTALPLLLAIFGAIYGISKNNEANKDKQARIDVQNQLAQMSKIHQEDVDTWSRLSQQRSDLENELKQQNQDLYNLVHNQGAQIDSLSTTIATMHPVHMVVNRPTETIVQGPDNTQRERVDFDQTHENYLRVHGFTLSNPAEADLTIEFTQPLRLTTVVTQNRDGSWRTYVSAKNWPDLQITSINTTVNPLIGVPTRQWYQNLILGSSINLTTTLDGFAGNIYALYSFDNVAIGPDLGIFVNKAGGNVFFGVSLEWRPF